MEKIKNWSDSPVFIIGNPRSGTTLLQLILTNHSDLFIPTESGFLLYLYDKYKYFNGDQKELKSFVEDVFKAKKFELWNIDFEGTLNYLREKKPINYQELSSGIYEYYGQCYYPKVSRWGDKNNYYLNHIEDICEIFPNVQFVHIIRDGRDVACSYKDMEKLKGLKYAPNLPNEIESIAQDWSENISTIRKSFEKICSNKFIEIRYEDLIEYSQETLERVCSFLNMEYSPEMLNYNNDKKLIPKEFDSWKSMNKKSINTSRIKRWENELLNPEVISFENIAGDILSRYKYDLFSK